MSLRTASSTWASPATGDVVAGFRIERLLGRREDGAVHEATQQSLGRTVALRLLEQSRFEDREFALRFEAEHRLSAAVHHPAIVPTYEAGRWDGGRFLATRYVRGRTLEELLEEGSLAPATVERVLAVVADALAAAHAAGLTHGRLTARNVLVDAAGSAFVTDFGLGRPGSVEADRDALAALALRTPGTARRRRGLRRLLTAAAAAAAVIATVVVVTRDGGEGEAAGQPAPPVAAGTVPLGSDLGPGPLGVVGCSDRPSPNTPACTLSQATIVGHATTVAKPGVIRRWALRGARGDLALQVIGRRGDRTFVRGFSQVERVPDGGPHSFAANVPVRGGDRVGVLLTPGAVIGARDDPGGTSALRWDGTLEFTPHRQSTGTLAKELLLRVDIDAGARPDGPPTLTGAAAAAAETGRPLEDAVVESVRRGAVRVELVRVAGGLALDAFRRGRRLARIEVPDADPDGRLLILDSHCGYPRGFCLRWLNEGATTPVIHGYQLTRGGEAFRLIG